MLLRVRWRDVTKCIRFDYSSMHYVADNVCTPHIMHRDVFVCVACLYHRWFVAVCVNMFIEIFTRFCFMCGLCGVTSGH